MLIYASFMHFFYNWVCTDMPSGMSISFLSWRQVNGLKMLHNCLSRQSMSWPFEYVTLMPDARLSPPPPAFWAPRSSKVMLGRPITSLIACTRCGAFLTFQSTFHGFPISCSVQIFLYIRPKGHTFFSSPFFHSFLYSTLYLLIQDKCITFSSLTMNMTGHITLNSPTSKTWDCILPAVLQVQEGTDVILLNILPLTHCSSFLT